MLCWAARWIRSPSKRKAVLNTPWHRSTELLTIASKTGCTSVGERLITRRTSLVAVCCSRASVAERCKSAYDGAGGASVWGRWRGVPHSPQNFIAGRFSCWHRGHVMPEPPSGRVGERSEPWAETTRPGLAWSRTRSLGPRLGMARPRSWLPHLHQPTADGQSGSALTPGKGRADFLGSVSSSSARLPAIRARRDHARSYRDQTARALMPLGRRRFMAAVAGGLLNTARAVEAQLPAGNARIGILLTASPPSDVASRLRDGVRAGLRQAGYVEGRGVTIEERNAEGNVERLRDLATELIQLRVAVIVTFGTPAALAAKA